MNTVKKKGTLDDTERRYGAARQETAKDNKIYNPGLTDAGKARRIGGFAPIYETPVQPPTPYSVHGSASPPPTSDAEGGTQAPAQNNGASYAGYTPSGAVAQAEALLRQHMTSKPGEYQSAWQGQLSDIIGQILNRDKFSYDLNADALYQQYADQYAQQGRMAMMDTMGQAQAMTGGYGNSYAQNVGQQAYQAYLQRLNDIVPELYDRALDQYNLEGQELYNRASLLAQQEDQDYGRYMDGLNAWLSERDFLTGRYDSERDYDYGRFIDDRNYQYQQQQDALAEQWRQKEFEQNQKQYEEQMAFNREQWAWEKANAGRIGGGGSDNGGSDAPKEEYAPYGSYTYNEFDKMLARYYENGNADQAYDFAARIGTAEAWDLFLTYFPDYEPPKPEEDPPTLEERKKRYHGGASGNF